MLARLDIEAGVFSAVLLPFELPRCTPPNPAVESVNLLFLFSDPNGIPDIEALSPSDVERIAIDSWDLDRRIRNQIRRPISATAIIATAVNVPATFPVSFQNPLS